MSPFQICSVLAGEGKNVSWKSVYYRWTVIQKTSYLRDENPFVSCLEYMRSASNLKLVYHSAVPQAIVFISIIGFNLSRTHNCSEAFIGSTHETDGSRFEFFTVVTKCMGGGFPVASLLFERNTDELVGSSKRKDMLKEFLSTVRFNLSNLRPKFFFTDKDAGQIYAIREVHYVVPSICLWHIKRAIRTKIHALRRNRREILRRDLNMRLQYE